MSYYKKPSIVQGNTVDEISIWPFSTEREWLDFFLVANWKEENGMLYRNSRLEVLSTIDTQILSQMAWAHRKFGEEKVARAFEMEINSRNTSHRSGPKEDLNKLKDSVDIVELIMHYVGDFRYRPGALLRCPFPDHKDGTASLSVNQKRGLFKCFGCQKQGSQLDFIMEITGCDLKEAIQKLKGFV